MGFENISNSFQKDQIERFFTLFYDELVLKNTPEFNRQKDEIALKICRHHHYSSTYTKFLETGFWFTQQHETRYRNQQRQRKLHCT